MFWLYFFSHALNPLLVFLYISIKHQDEDKDNDPAAAEYILAIMIFGSLVYSIWIAVHAAIFWLIDKPFSIDKFIGIGQSVVYFIPVIIGAVMIIIDIVLSKVHSDKARKTASTCFVILALFGVYGLSVNYLHWLKHV